MCKFFLQPFLFGSLLCALSVSYGQGPTPPGGGGGNETLPKAIGHGWYLTEKEFRTSDSTSGDTFYNGQFITTTYERNWDLFNDQWRLNGALSEFAPGNPNGGQTFAEWTAEGQIYFKFEYLGQGAPTSDFFIIVDARAEAQASDGFLATGAVYAFNGFDGGIVDTTQTAVGKRSVARTRRLLHFKPNTSMVEYLTPTMSAQAHSAGNNVNAGATISATIEATNKSIAVWNSASPIYKAGSETQAPILLSFSNSSATANVMATTFTQEVVTPHLTGVTNYAIQYEIARPWQKKHRFYGPVPMGGGVITVQWTDLDPDVPGAFFIAHEGSASPMGTMSASDTFRWDSGPDQFSPPHYTIPASPNVNRICDYVQLDEQFNIHGNILALYDKSQPQETVSHKLKYNWADGVTGSATATYTIRNKKYDELETLHSAVVFSDLLGWKPLTDKMAAGTYQGANLTEITTVSYLKEFVVMNETVVSLAAANRNPYIAGLAALIGISATALTTENVPIERIENSSYNKVWPSNWLSHIQQPDPPSYKFIDHIGNFRWQTQILESSHVNVVNTKKFFTRGYQGTAPRYSYSRDALQGNHRTVYWLASQEDTIPSSWWTS